MPDLDAFSALQLVGLVAFALSGAAVAVRAGMDWLGIVVLATVTSIGGGTIRDLLIGDGVGWVTEPWPIWGALATAVLVIAVAHWSPRHEPDSLRLVLVADAAGLAVFTVLGTTLALSAGLEREVAVMLGVVSGVGGGVIRDVLAGQRPLVLVGQVYALTAIAGATLFVALDAGDLDRDVARWSAVAVTFVLRVLAIRYDWTLPRPGDRRPA
ncbi:trimeric intracellular cation channel family protein [Aeromicrobium sp. Leaf350]|uniref:trimeric intracellular cation channel family protein n=1 Tax=Aeromicrobium sp. Leaf350 TaxID=2876565 RepID=UPI001E62CADF|nr:trimeric intracellular cation channel family protein [Aeromicrobium sp. Leaf350]